MADSIRSFYKDENELRLPTTVTQKQFERELKRFLESFNHKCVKQIEHLVTDKKATKEITQKWLEYGCPSFDERIPFNDPKNDEYWSFEGWRRTNEPLETTQEWLQRLAAFSDEDEQALRDSYAPLEITRKKDGYGLLAYELRRASKVIVWFTTRVVGEKLILNSDSAYDLEGFQAEFLATLLYQLGLDEKATDIRTRFFMRDRWRDESNQIERLPFELCKSSIDVSDQSKTLYRITSAGEIKDLPPLPIDIPTLLTYSIQDERGAFPLQSWYVPPFFVDTDAPTVFTTLCTFLKAISGAYIQPTVDGVSWHIQITNFVQDKHNKKMRFKAGLNCFIERIEEGKPYPKFHEEIDSDQITPFPLGRTFVTLKIYRVSKSRCRIVLDGWTQAGKDVIDRLIQFAKRCYPELDKHNDMSASQANPSSKQQSQLGNNGKQNDAQAPSNLSSGRPRYESDEWARYEHHVNKRQPMQIRSVWQSKRRTEMENRGLSEVVDWDDTFRKMLKRKPK